MEKAPMPLPGTVPVPAPVPVDENPAVLDEKTSGDGHDSLAAGLTEDEKSIIQRQLDAPNEKVGYLTLFRYANKQEMLIMFVSFLASVVAGACLPLMTLVYGNFAGSFTSFSIDALAAERFKHQINTFTLYFVYLGKSYLHRLLTRKTCANSDCRHRFIRLRLCWHDRIFIHRRTHHTANPRTVLESHLPTKYRLLRFSW
jgi:hypothetical protein